MSVASVQENLLPRILIVDDEAEVRILLRSALEKDGYQLLEAENGDAALEIVSKQAIDVVILDLNMPGCNGIETCRKIRQELQMLTLPIVALTGYQETQMRIQFKSAGADEFLYKPFDRTELLARIRNLIAVKKFHDFQFQMKEQLQNELENAKESILRADRLAILGNLASGIGHELKNLSGIFKLSLEGIEEKTAQQMPAELEDLKRLKHVGEHFDLHIQNLLSRGKPMQPKWEKWDLSKIIEQTINMLSIAGRLKNIDLRTDIAAGSLFIFTDPLRIEQMLVNLILNACDALETKSVARIQIRCFREQAEVICEVEDNGCGIAQEDLEKIFEPYYTTKTFNKGTGLGLTVVKQVIQEVGGRLEIKSKKGCGTKMIIALPAHELL